MRDVHDTDGRWGRLAAWLGGRGVPSVDDALLEMDLAPLHEALRRGDQAAALAAVAARLDAPVPESEATTGTADAVAIGRAIEEAVTASAPALSRGKWVYEWLVERVWPDADLIALMLDTAALQAGARTNGNRPLELLRDERFRRAIGVNEHGGETWFDQERFDSAVALLELSNGAELRRAATASGYRLDRLEKLLAEPPVWASTRPVKSTARRAAPRPPAKKSPPPTPKPAKK
jgi:hypothetical protein